MNNGGVENWTDAVAQGDVQHLLVREGTCFVQGE